ncbi:heparin lyase I family protein [Chitiniphilus purpureus]|uniref:Heparin lyase I family protein n=1 Tax=Chitiniphilus purpureus TaxID=2981137 RepID=A0ABY6DK47_9NEIS|nr:heparin lyase I family protein [Chitiniphilus sp. CD1]UXY14063.1 heparin lyase I family protein [Chitiniphilus sp. CD1]
MKNSLVLCVSLLLPLTFSHAQESISIDAESASFKSGTSPQLGTLINTDGTSFTTQRRGAGDHPAISSRFNSTPAGNSSVKFQLAPLPNNDAKRSELVISNKPAFDIQASLQFKVYIPEDGTFHVQQSGPDTWLALVQLWQNLNCTVACNPPVSLEVEDGANPDANPVLVRLRVRNDQTGNYPIVPYTGSLSKGVWHYFKLNIKPSVGTGGNVGKVEIYYGNDANNNTLVGSYSGQVGFSSNPPSFLQKIGLYGGQLNQGLQTAYFDDIQYTSP